MGTYDLGRLSREGRTSREVPDPGKWIRTSRRTTGGHGDTFTSGEIKLGSQQRRNPKTPEFYIIEFSQKRRRIFQVQKLDVPLPKS